jgi:hypothetical protein
MPSRRLLLLVSLALTLAAPRAGEAGVALGARLFGAYNNYGMGDWDRLLAAMRIRPGTFARARDGYSMGAGGEFLLGKSLTLALTYERLVPGRMDTLFAQKLRLPANAFLLDLEYRHRIAGRFSMGAGGGGGWYQLGDEIESRDTGVNLDGTGSGGHAAWLADWAFTPNTSLGLSVGYRWARVDVSKINRKPPRFPVEADYSGRIARLGLRFHPHLR